MIEPSVCNAEPVRRVNPAWWRAAREQPEVRSPGAERERQGIGAGRQRDAMGGARVTIQFSAAANCARAAHPEVKIPIARVVMYDAGSAGELSLPRHTCSSQ